MQHSARNSRESYPLIMESTQDFEALFLNPKDVIEDENSKSKQKAGQKNRSKESNGEKD